MIPEFKGREAEEILLKDVQFDSSGYFFRAASWVDFAYRKRAFTPLIYACADARHGIEYLLFESLILSTGANIDEETYKRCTKERNSFEKLIRKLSPDYIKLQEFTKASLSAWSDAPRLIFWDHRKLMKDWGHISSYLHWFGAITRTTDDPEWIAQAYEKIAGIIIPLWEKASSGPMGLLHDSQMTDSARALWYEYRAGELSFAELEKKLAESIS